MRKPFESKPEYQEALHALKEFTASKSYGYLLTYTDVERLIGFPKGSQEFDYLLRVRFVKEMRKHRSIVLDPVNSVGYRFMHPDEVVGERVPLRMRKSRNQMTKGERELETVTDDLTKIKSLSRRRLAIAATEYLQERRKEINSALRAMRKTETLPSRKPL